jgi:hypothetical protein
VFLPVLFFLAALCSAQDLNSYARDLARKINRQDIVNVAIRNSSSLPETQVADVRRSIEAELRFRPRPGAEGSSVNITLSENVDGYLWVAEILKAEQREVVFLNVPRPAGTPVPPAAVVTIEKKLIWEQEKPILDVAISGDLLVVLDSTAVSFYRDRQMVSSFPISKPMPRDPRGKLEIEGSSFRAQLPGMVCWGTTGATMSCTESSVGVVAGRNYFNVPPLPFYSVATLASVRMMAGVDGRAHLYDNSLRELRVIDGWGSDIAAVNSACGSGRQILATKPGDAAEPDAIQSYEVVDTRVAPSGDPVTFPGPVTALWPTVVVARNTETGRYAAYSLAITCSR